MGGSALMIYGTVSERVLEPKPAPRSFMNRLFGRTQSAPQWRPLGANRQLITVPADDLDALGSEFRDHVVARFEKPWAATRAIIDYLGTGPRRNLDGVRADRSRGLRDLSGIA